MTNAPSPGERTVCLEGCAQRKSVRFPEVEVAEVLSEMGFDPEKGVPIRTQVRKYGHMFGQMTDPDRNDAAKKCRRQLIHGRALLTRTTAQRVSAAKDLVELQRRIVIIDVNEFLLRRRPTREEFEALLRDFIAWETACCTPLFQGESARLRQDVEAYCESARTRFQELCA